MKKLREILNLLNPISNEVWLEIECLFERKKLNKNEYFIKEGDIAKNIAFLSSGIVRAFYRTKEGKEYNKHFFNANSIIGGYASLITRKNNQINQQALINCEIYVANYFKFSKLYEKYPVLETLARKIAENRFVEKEQREIELVTLNADERYLIFRKEYPNLELIISQYHIASYLGVSATQLSRIRRKMAKE